MVDKKVEKIHPHRRAKSLHRMPHHALRRRPTYHHAIHARSAKKQAQLRIRKELALTPISDELQIPASAGIRKLPELPSHAVKPAIAAPKSVPSQPPVLSIEPKPSIMAVPDEPIVGETQISEKKHSLAEDLHDWVLGGQDGLVNVLGSILGVAIVTTDRKIIIVAGLASLLAESISMAAVAYTSVRASHSYYASEREAQRNAIKENPVLQKEILIDIYEKKGLSRADAHRVVTELTKNEDVWLETMMEEHLRMYKPEEAGPLHSTLVVGFASLIGSLIPLMPFFFLPVMSAIIVSCISSIIMLFIAGAITAKLTIGDWKARGIEMMIIGGLAAAVSFSIGYLFTSGIITVG